MSWYNIDRVNWDVILQVLKQV